MEVKEAFHYSHHEKESNAILAIFISVFALVLVMTLTAMTYLYQAKQMGLLYTLFLFLLFPSYITQFLCFFISGYILCKNLFSIRTGIPWSLLAATTFIYFFTVFILIHVALYFLSNMTQFDLQNKDIYKENFVPSDKLVKLGLIDQKNISVFKDMAQKGKEHVKNKRIVFGLLTKNSVAHIHRMRQKLSTLGKSFGDYHIVLFENDSVDGTREALFQWQKEDKHVTLLSCCHLGDCDCHLNWKDQMEMKGFISETRINRMRMMRQLILDHIHASFSDYDYAAFMDFDLRGAIYEDGFFTSFYYPYWDVQFAAGYTSMPLTGSLLLYDAIAYLGENDTLPYKNKSELIKMMRDLFYQNFQLRQLPIPTALKRCRSGFNGLSLYRMKALKGASYTKTTFSCEHIDLHLDLIRRGFDNIFFNPAMILFVGHQGPVRKNIWKLLS